MRVYLLSMVLLMGSFLLEGRVIRVPSEYPTIQEGIDAANPGDTVLVASGVYNESNITMRNGVYLLSEEGPETTIIDCGGGEGIEITGCDSLTVVDGFTIRNGGRAKGGGICIWGSKALIQNNIIEYNTAELDPFSLGGGIAALGHSKVTIRRNIIRYNDSYGALGDGTGGGIAINSCDTAIIEENRIVDNVVVGDWEGGCGVGGGIYIAGTPAIINSNIIQNNYAIVDGPGSGIGAGIFISCGSNKRVVIINNLITGNVAQARWYDEGWGAGIYCKAPAVIVNNTIAHNYFSGLFMDTLFGYGGGIYCENTSDTMIICNNIIAFNLADTGGGIFCSDSARIVITYNDFFMNLNDNIYNPPPGVGEGYPYDSFYNMNYDPWFVSGPEGNYYLMRTPYWSPCVDAGSFEACGGFEQRTTSPDGTPDAGRVDLGYHYGTAHIDVETILDVMLGVKEHLYAAPHITLRCYPNPFNSKLTINYSLPAPEDATLCIYDATGRLVKRIEFQFKQTGVAIWDGNTMPNGTYFVQLKTPEYEVTKKVILVK